MEKLFNKFNNKSLFNNKYKNYTNQLSLWVLNINKFHRTPIFF